MLRVCRVAGQLFARIAGAQDVHGLITGGLRKRPIKGDKLVPDLQVSLLIAVKSAGVSVSPR